MTCISTNSGVIGSEQAETVRGSRIVILGYDVALSRMLRSRRLRALVKGAETVHYVGYPTIVPPEAVLAKLSGQIGVRVIALPGLTYEEYQQLYEMLSRISRSCTALAPVGGLDFPWSAVTAADRVTYRLAPIYKVEAHIRTYCCPGAGACLILPWSAREFGLVERPGVAGLDAPGHELHEVVARLVSSGCVRVETLWGDRTNWERGVIRCSRIVNFAARWSDRTRRTIAGKMGGSKEARPMERRCTSQSVAIGFVIDGAATFQSLRPLVAKARARGIKPMLLTREQVVSPTARRSLQLAGETCVPVDSLLGPLDFAESAWRLVSATRRIRKQLRELEAGTEAERARVAAADLPMLPFLGIYAKQIDAAITRFHLKAIVTANMVDSYFGTATEVCHRHRIPLVGVQNGCNELIRFPFAPYCDLYFCESSRTAAFLRSGDTKADVRAVGLPYFDELLMRSGSCESVLVETMPWLAGKRILGITTQPDGVDLGPVLDRLVEAVETRSDVAIVIKLHPRQRADTYARLAERLRKTGSGGCVHLMPISDFLRDCDALVSCFSSTILWSIVAGVRPFAYISPTSRRVENLSYMDERVTFQSTDPDVVVGAALEGLYDKAEQAAWRDRRRRFIGEHLDGVDGKACDRVLDQTLEFCARYSRL